MTSLDRAFEALFALNYEDEKRRLLLSEARLALASIRALDQMDERPAFVTANGSPLPGWDK